MKLLNPGPVTLTERVRRALVRPDACHREADFVALAADVRARLAAVYPEAATTHQAILLTASGTGAVEAMLGSLLTKDDRCLVVANGVYGERAAAILTAQGKNFSLVRGEWTAPLDSQEIARRLDGTFTHVFAVHHETTTGRLNDLDALGRLCRERNVALLLDAVSSFAGEALRFAAWNLLACAATANKCLHSAPGLAFVLVDRAALARPSGAPSVYLDLHRYAAAGFPFTPAVPALYALDEALRELDDDGGVVARHARYCDLSTQLRRELRVLGIALVLQESAYASMLTSFHLPAGLDYASLHDRLKESGFVIYAGQGPLAGALFRIAVMGDVASADIEKLVHHIGACLINRSSF